MDIKKTDGPSPPEAKRRSSKWKSVQRKFKLAKNENELSQDDFTSIEQKCQQEISDMTKYFIERRGLFKMKKQISTFDDDSSSHDCQPGSKNSRCFHPNDNRHTFLKKNNVLEEVSNYQKPDMDSSSSF